MSEEEPATPLRSSAFAPTLPADPGVAPGSIVVPPDAGPLDIHVIAYGSGEIQEHEGASLDDVRRWVGRQDVVVWVNVTGLGDAASLRELQSILGIHRLAIEDAVNVYQRPKCEEYDETLFIVTRMPVVEAAVSTEQVSLFLTEGVLVSFQEYPGDCLNQVRARIRSGKGTIRERSADYLAYAVLDAITDAYFPVLESFGERLDQLEDAALERPTLDTLVAIRQVKKELLLLRRTIWPMREMFAGLMRDGTPGIVERTKPYLRDCYDHVTQLVDITENYRELASGLTDVYMSTTGHRMNEIMKVLTIVATIFIPLTFVAGVYGMNFNPEKGAWNMPELSWRYGYLACCSVMLMLGLGMVYYFRRLGWLGGTK